MTNVIRHRGPDDEGFAFFNPQNGEFSYNGGTDTPTSVYRAHASIRQTNHLTASFKKEQNCLLTVVP